MKKYLCCIIVILITGGCGYRMSSGLTPTGVSSVTVPIFDNATLFRNFEFQVTQAVVDEILTKTSLRVVEPEYADSVLKGTITDLQIRSVIKNENRESLNQDIIITVIIEWIDRRSAQEIVPKRTLTRRVKVDLEQGENFNVEAAEAFQDLARIIVYQLDSRHLLEE